MQIPKILEPTHSLEYEEVQQLMFPKLDELDSDLYDRISYLDLVHRQREQERRRKLEHLQSMRRLREDADKLSARGSARNQTNTGQSGEYTLNGLTNSAAPSSSRYSSNRPAVEGANIPTELKVHLPAITESPAQLAMELESIFSESNIYMPSVPAIDSKIQHIWDEAMDLSEIRNIEDQTEFRSLRVQLGIDKISAETMTRYYVRGHMDGYDQPAICYPRYHSLTTANRVPTGLKIIRRIGEKLKKENFPEPTEEGKARFSGMFGCHMITPSDNRVVLTTNERDALAVYDATNGIPSLSLPAAERLDQTVLPYLENFELIYLWFSQMHESHAKNYASYLNASRCYIITKTERPIELIRYNRAKEILHGIQEALRVRYRGFRSLIDLRDEVKNEIVDSKTRICGIAQWKRYDVLNHYLKGFRPGELTVLSGGTGYGKTTFLCEYSMDLYTQGVRTLFCSFELPEEKILKWMIIQFSGIPLHRVDHHGSVEMWLDRFERTRSDLIVMKVDDFRNKSTKDIAEVIKEQVIASGIQHVVIDNLQFLIGLATIGNDSISAQEKENIQDRFVGLLRRLANQYEIHITIVVHPKRNNELENVQLELHNIGGSSRIVQEADNVLIIQRRRDQIDKRRFRKFLYILKNRFGQRRAENDQIEMVFQPSTYTHTLIETTPSK